MHCLFSVWMGVGGVKCVFSNKEEREHERDPTKTACGVYMCSHKHNHTALWLYPPPPPLTAVRTPLLWQHSAQWTDALCVCERCIITQKCCTIKMTLVITVSVLSLKKVNNHISPSDRWMERMETKIACSVSCVHKDTRISRNWCTLKLH